MSRFALISSWIVAVMAGFCLLTSYELAPGASEKSPDVWPQNPHISLHPDKPTLVMFVHPHCPCTRASVSELSVLLTKCKGRVETYVLPVQPAGAAEGWSQTDMIEQAKQIPGVNVLIDIDGGLANQFQANTSGETMLYDESGQLRFCGGITASRGHHGDSDGRRCIVDWILRGIPGKSVTPVFGCPLQDEQN